jgi:hypothetical protein
MLISCVCLDAKVAKQQQVQHADSPYTSLVAPAAFAAVPLPLVALPLPPVLPLLLPPCGQCQPGVLLHLLLLLTGRHAPPPAGPPVLLPWLLLLQQH